MTAEQNQRIAIRMLAIGGEMPEANRWAVIAAFYAAVHYVNAYLWEVARLAPHSHDDRELVMARWPVLQSMLGEYMLLRDYAFRARYRAGNKVSAARATDLVTTTLPALEQVIRANIAT